MQSDPHELYDLDPRRDLQCDLRERQSKGGGIIEIHFPEESTNQGEAERVVASGVRY